MAKKDVNRLDRIQYATLEVSEAVSAAGRAEAFPTALSLRDRTGIEILSADYLPVPNTLAALGAASDGVIVAIGQIEANIPNSGDLYPGGTLDIAFLHNLPVGVASQVLYLPVTHTFPEPLLCHPASLYGFVRGLNLVAVLAAAWIRIGYRYVDLSDNEYQDILQTMIAQNVL